jgi:hypothetical protein
MQRTKTIQIAGCEITVSEISVSRIYKMLRGDDAIINLPLPEALQQCKHLLPLAVDCDLVEMLAGEDVFYDDVIALKQAFEETNPAFFETARALGLGGVLASILSKLVESFCSRFAGALSTATGLPSGTTDTDFSAT